MHYYEHHIGDFMRDTAHLSALEECFYRRALDFCYLNEKPLPKETQQVMRRLRANNEEEMQAVKNMLADFFIETDDGFHQKRCDEEIARYHARGDSSRENGKKGGRPPKRKPNENPSETQSVNLGYENENLDVTHNNLNQQPLTNNQLNKKENASDEKTEGNLYVVPSRRVYEMFIGWKPEPELWAQTLKASQHLVKSDQFTDYTLAEFIRSNVGKDEKMESEWQRFYVNAVARGYVKPITDKPKSQKQPEPEIDYSKPQNLIVPVVYPYDPEERARQSAEMKRIRKEQGR